MGEAFRNNIVMLCRPGDSQLARANWPKTGGFEQDESGPVMIVVGSLTSDEKCDRLGERFGVEGSRLRNFRDMPNTARVVVVDAKGGRHD